jgi:outer membrane lipoprotein SlyB
VRLGFMPDLPSLNPAWSHPMNLPTKTRSNPMHILGAATLAIGLSFAAGCASTGPGYSSGGNYNSGGGNYNSGNPGNSGNYGNCYDCGIVTKIEGAGNGTKGAVIGGILGAVVGHEVSAKTGGSTGNQNLSTVAGAAAGAVAGNAIAKNRFDSGYLVHIRMNDGRMTSINQTDLGGIREGSRVRISNGRAYAQ